MPQVQLDYQTLAAKSARRAIRRIVIIPAIIWFGSATAVFVFLGVTWSSQLAVDSQFSAHSDGMRGAKRGQKVFLGAPDCGGR